VFSGNFQDRSRNNFQKGEKKCAIDIRKITAKGTVQRKLMGGGMKIGSTDILKVFS